MSSDSIPSREPITSSLAVAGVVLLWLGYTALQTASVMGRLSAPWAAILGFVPGILGVAVLLVAGLSPEACFLRFGRLSWAGFAVLAAVFCFALAAVLPLGTWQGWNWQSALVYAPATGISQELFFRSALLPALQWRLRAPIALALHAVLFGLWHIAPLFLGAPIWAVLAVMFVPFLSGLGWGWQVRRDRTVVWAMIQHSLIWVIGLQFPLPG